MTPFKGRKVKVTWPINAVTETSHIIGTGRPTNVRLIIRMEYDDCITDMRRNLKAERLFKSLLACEVILCVMLCVRSPKFPVVDIYVPPTVSSYLYRVTVGVRSALGLFLSLARGLGTHFQTFSGILRAAVTVSARHSGHSYSLNTDCM